MRKKAHKPMGFSELYRKIRKDVPAPMRVEEPRKGKGHTYTKRDRRTWKKGVDR
jgi:hypothetical protein